MKLWQWVVSLSLQVFGILWAIWIFASPMDRSLAGLIAGSGFVIVGLWPAWVFRKQAGALRCVMFWTTWGFLLFGVFPIFAMRLLNWGEPFDDLQLMNLTGRDLHRWSESLYTGLIVATLWDGVRFFVWPRFFSSSQ